MLGTAAKHAQKPQSKREIMLDAAADLFLQEGYGEASINKLIDRIGGSKATVYAYFQNKERLFEAVVESIVEEIPAFINDVQFEGLDLREGLTSISVRLLEIATSPRHLALARIIIAEGDRFPEIGKIYYEQAPQHICAVLTEFLESRAGAKLKIARADLLIESFTGMVLHHQLFRQFCLDPAPPSKKQIRDLAVRNANMFIAMLTMAEFSDA